MPQIINPSDVQYSVLLETVAGTTPTTGSRYLLPVAANQNPIAFSSADVVSNTKRPNGAKNGLQRGPKSGTGTINMPMMFSPVYSQLLEGALRGKFTTTGTKTLKPGTTDSTFSVLQLLKPGAAGSAILSTAKGSAVTKATISAEAGSAVNVAFDFLSSAEDQLQTDSALVPTDVLSTAYEFTGADVNSLNIAGNMTVYWKSLSLEFGQPRNNRYVLGTNVSVGNAPSDQRDVKLTIRVYRDDTWVIDTLLTGQRQAFSFNVGTAGAGYGFFIFGHASIPQTELDSESAYVNIEVSGAYDGTGGGDIYITQL
ncbi:phage tail tube protein [Sphingomonas sp. R1]|uniref:phage tail tube protein n=1 Tax=Sphingomonas sp. R1 TaxID=399176 RepID=UPI002224DC7D|nr:phage tail tube protein [Sphingomonas sp. R1]UYY77494.1 phage tail tube protein [Sphingomonas sp. R1]